VIRGRDAPGRHGHAGVARPGDPTVGDAIVSGSGRILAQWRSCCHERNSRLRRGRAPHWRPFTVRRSRARQCRASSSASAASAGSAELQCRRRKGRRPAQGPAQCRLDETRAWSSKVVDDVGSGRKVCRARRRRNRRYRGHRRQRRRNRRLDAERLCHSSRRPLRGWRRARSPTRARGCCRPVIAAQHPDVVVARHAWRESELARARCAKCAASEGTSATRSRSAGSSIGKTARRYQRSSRIDPRGSSFAGPVRGRHDAHVGRDRLLAAHAPCTRPSCSTRSRRTCAGSGSSATSSRNSVPPWRLEPARRCATAPVKLPRSWPKSSESIQLVGIAPQLTGMNDRSARGTAGDRARDDFLPLPVSPEAAPGQSGARHLCHALHHVAQARVGAYVTSAMSLRPRRPSSDIRSPRGFRAGPLRPRWRT